MTDIMNARKNARKTAVTASRLWGTLASVLLATLGCQAGNPLASQDAGSGSGGGPAAGGESTGGTGGSAGGSGGSEGPGGSAGGSAGGGEPSGGQAGGGTTGGAENPGGQGGGPADAGPPADGPTGPAGDRDDDGVPDDTDNCPALANHNQEDADEDGLGDICDVCPAVADPSQVDTDEDGLGDACDPNTPMGPPEDRDDDGVANATDNCPNLANHGQENVDGDAAGDVCDACPADPENVQAPCAPQAQVDPGRLDFAHVPVDCGRTSRDVRVTGDADACLASAALIGPCRGVSLSGLGGNCRSLAQAQTITVTWQPPDAGPLNCSLEIRVTNGRDATLTVPLAGEAGGRRITERYIAETPEQVDIVLVMDDSASMEPIQSSFQGLYGDFVRRADNEGTRWRLGVVTTDMEDANRSGRFFGPGDFGGGPNAERDWAEAMTPGTRGSGTEQGLAATEAALVPARNPGFHAANADLVVVVVSDEDDQSPQAPNNYVRAWMNASPGHPERVTAYGVNGVNANGAAVDCDSQNIHGAAATRYVTAFGLVGGRSYTICGDHVAALRAISERIFGPRRAFLLSQTPDGAPTVRVDGNPDARWAFSVQTGVVRLPGNEDSVREDAVVEVEYDAVCP